MCWCNPEVRTPCCGICRPPRSTTKIEFYDIRGRYITKNSVIIYGESNRNYPINIGRVVNISEDFVEVLGKNNTKTGKIPKFHINRILVLPDDYLE